MGKQREKIDTIGAIVVTILITTALIYTLCQWVFG